LLGRLALPPRRRGGLEVFGIRFISRHRKEGVALTAKLPELGAVLLTGEFLVRVAVTGPVDAPLDASDGVRRSLLVHLRTRRFWQPLATDLSLLEAINDRVEPWQLVPSRGSRVSRARTVPRFEVVAAALVVHDAVRELRAEPSMAEAWSTATRP